MHEAEPYGHLRLKGRDIGPEILARMVGTSTKMVSRLLAELEIAGVFSRTEQGTVYSRRMVKDQDLRLKRGQFGHLSQNHPHVPRKKGDKDTDMDTEKDTITPSFERSPSSSSSSSISVSSTDKKKIHDGPPAVDHGFEEFWELYPMRNGKRLGKPEALARFRQLKSEDRLLILTAVGNYAASEMTQKGIGIKDAHRWLRNGKDSEPWRDWLTPEQPVNSQEVKNGKHRLPRVGFEERDYRQGTF